MACRRPARPGRSGALRRPAGCGAATGRQAHFAIFAPPHFRAAPWSNEEILAAVAASSGVSDGASGGKSHLGHEEPLICSAQLTLGV
jgi:hypothetical protein